MKRIIIIFSILVFCLVQLPGQSLLGLNDFNIPSFEEIKEWEIITEDFKTKKSDFLVELNVANDMTFFTDHYFSSGITLKLYAPFMSKSPFNKIMLPHPADALNYYALTFTHNLYTPIYIDTLNYRSIDHPFAAYVLLGNKKESFVKSQRYKLTSELQVGWIGPMVGGRVFQNTLHDHISIAGPVDGWEYQINNDFCLQYSALFEKGIVDAPGFELNFYTGGKLGIPHTEAQFGMYLRTGYFDDFFNHIGIHKKTNWQLWLFCAGDANYVLYNAVLQGGLLNRENSNSLQTINPILWHSRFGGTLVYKSVKLEIAQEVVSPSFPTALWHRWAYVSFMVGF